jgi:hypothetical protein
MSASLGLPAGSFDAPRVEVLDEAECYRLLASESVGRVVYTDGALPAITPVNYVLDGRRVLFRTAPGSRLAAGVVGAVVAFEVDWIDTATASGWSVVITGLGRVCTPSAYAGPPTPSVRPWAGGHRDELLTITPGRVTGRRIG